MYKRKVRVLFLCSGNSCRSQMAEGYANALGSSVLEAKSAGIKVHGINPRAIAAMQEDDIDIRGQESTVVTDELMKWADLVVTVCGDVDEHCPPIPPTAQKKHWPLSDPAKAAGTEEEIMQQFRTVRDEIKRRVNSLLGGIKMMSK